MSSEKLAKRPHVVTPEEWSDIDALRRIREEMQKKIRGRGSNDRDMWENEQTIEQSFQVSKRIRELEPPLVIPTDSDDRTTRLRSLPVYDRAVRIAQLRVRDAAHIAHQRDTGTLDVASQALHRLIKARDTHPDAPSQNREGAE